jgi:hypothetical protein
MHWFQMPLRGAFLLEANLLTRSRLEGRGSIAKLNIPRWGLFEVLSAACNRLTHREIIGPEVQDSAVVAEAARQDKGPYLAEAAPTFAAGLVKVIEASMSPSVVFSNAERPA